MCHMYFHIYNIMTEHFSPIGRHTCFTANHFSKCHGKLRNNLEIPPLWVKSISIISVMIQWKGENYNK